MPFSFLAVCGLLEGCAEDLASNPRSNCKKAVASWFDWYRDEIDDPQTDLVALLSALLPEKRTDRVFSLGEKRLEGIFARAFRLGPASRAALASYREPGSDTDLADCIGKAMSALVDPNSDKLTAEEVDAHLHNVASQSLFSSPEICRKRATDAEVDLGWQRLFASMDGTQGKWFARMVLKDLRPAELDPRHLLSCCHPILPFLFKVRDDFTAAVGLLQDLRTKGVVTPVMKPAAVGAVMRSIKPSLGVQVSRPDFLIGRSIKMCRDLSSVVASVEKKIDGEYCQVHVDLSKPAWDQIQIFSKSGKDSTEDRKYVFRAIRESLRLGSDDCKISKGCILEGELVVYSDRTKSTCPFSSIRKHVARRGVFIGTENDSPRHEWEHLMIVYFNVLLVDDESLINATQTERFRRLRHVITPREGHAQLVGQEIVDFRRDGAARLRESLARTILEHGEGLVIKPDEPHFSFGPTRRRFESCGIKLKQEYIQGFGDVGDFAVVAARRDHRKARQLGIPGVAHTHFYIACLTNKESFARWKAADIPEFKVVNEVEVNDRAQFRLVRLAHRRRVAWGEERNLKLDFNRRMFANLPDVVFEEPLVFDMRSFQFDKPSGADFWALRFPLVGAVHLDRDWGDVMSYDELQRKAEEAKGENGVDVEDSQELQRMVERLKRADPRGIAADAETQRSEPRMSPSAVHAVRRPRESGPPDMHGVSCDGGGVLAAAGRQSPKRDLPADASQPPTKRPMRVSPDGGCALAGRRCSFLRRSVVLSPDLRGSDADHPVRSLLDDHNIEPADIGEWCGQGGGDDGGGGGDSHGGVDGHHRKSEKRKKRLRKMCLVDVRSTTAMQFLDDLARQPILRLPSGDEEIIAVYDWRLLETIARVEDDTCLDKKLGGWTDPWRRWFVGYVRGGEKREERGPGHGSTVVV